MINDLVFKWKRGIGMSTTAENKKMVGYIHIAIMLVITFGVGFLPPFGQITELGMKVLGCFLGVVYGWIFIDLLWVSFFGFAVLTMTGYATANEVLASGFGNATFLMVLLGAAFAECLNQIGVIEGIAYWLLSKKIFVGKPWLLIVAICLCAFLMSMGHGGIAAVFLLWTVALKIGEISGYKPGSRVLNMLIALIVYIAFTAPNMVPFYGGVILYGGFFTKGSGLAVPAGPMLLAGMIYVIIAATLMLLIGKFVLKIDAEHYTITKELCEEYATYKMNKYQKTGLLLVVTYFLILLLPSVIPTLPGAAFCNSLGVIGWGVLYMTIFVMWKDEKGVSIIDLGECFAKLPWAMLMLLAVTYPLADAMESADVGITATISKTVTPILMNMDVTLLIIVTMIFLGIVTQFMHNIVMGAIFLPIIPPIVMQMGGNPYTCFFLMYLALMCAYATPAGSMMAGMVFGHKTMVRKDAYMWGVVFLLVTIVVAICMIPLLNILFAM